MPKITLDPRVADVFVEMDWRERARLGKTFDEELVRNYEAGNVILLKNPPFSIEVDVFRRVSFPAGVDYKKLQAPFLTRPKLYKPRVAKFMFGVFGPDLALYLRFRRAVRDLTAHLTDFNREVFRTYRFVKQDVNWRFTPTGPELIHFDHVRSTADLQYVRVFVNLDDAPRIWKVGPQLEEMIDRHYDTAALNEMHDEHANEICERINNRVFERQNELADGPVPRHHVEFQPGEVWLCESRINSHEIYSGNRVVITHFHADPRSMLDPERRVCVRVANAMERRRSNAAAGSPKLAAARRKSAAALPY